VTEADTGSEPEVSYTWSLSGTGPYSESARPLAETDSEGPCASAHPGPPGPPGRRAPCQCQRVRVTGPGVTLIRSRQLLNLKRSGVLLQ
jgi:hypothetical protein